MNHRTPALSTENTFLKAYDGFLKGGAFQDVFNEEIRPQFTDSASLTRTA